MHAGSDADTAGPVAEGGADRRRHLGAVFERRSRLVHEARRGVDDEPVDVDHAGVDDGDGDTGGAGGPRLLGVHSIEVPLVGAQRVGGRLGELQHRVERDGLLGRGRPAEPAVLVERDLGIGGDLDRAVAGVHDDRVDAAGIGVGRDAGSARGDGERRSAGQRARREQHSHHRRPHHTPHGRDHGGRNHGGGP